MEESDKLLDMGAQAYQQGDYQDAQKYYEQSAEMGNAQAACNLGYIYAFGRNGVQDDQQAFAWFKKSALKGNPNAGYKVGDAYLLGKGIEKDPNVAYEFYERSREIVERSDQDDDLKAAIYYRIALCGHRGYGVEQNDLISLRFINEAEFYSYCDRFADQYGWQSTAKKIEKLRTEILTNLDDELEE